MEKLYMDNETLFKIDPAYLPDKIHIIDKSLEDIANYGENDVTIDMDGVSHLNSLLLSVLIRFRSKLFITGRNLRLVNCNERVINSIKLAALEDYFLN